MSTELSPGMKVKCISADWHDLVYADHPYWRESGVSWGDGPVIDGVCVVEGMLFPGELTKKGILATQLGLSFARWNYWFPAKCFRPLDQVDELQELIRGIDAPLALNVVVENVDLSEMREALFP
jgi:hypothetical protein